MATSERLTYCNCFASRKAARLITKLYEDRLSTVGLTSTQFSILIYVDDAGAASMKDLVDGLVMERTSVVRALQPLERDGYLAIGPDQEDARRNVVRLSDAGRRKLAEALPVWQAAQEEFERKFGSELASQLRESTHKLGT
ncbi:MarR family winged helix-turn-helix transcriptional regulator [Massilia sp. YIM B02763]|uniref:MarR family winged helix-turn-helix transcriptional regulator n=1 Tax=Massilia sp. YIM B02763 TaxID=3050130 RepID=UPI0025B6E29E|nr:MarR family winged helix-turn-helix transcriptional regulator [Massilia sp. YIM B02763]MDN4055352.1 MarR family winged helix-turn-helix transcriptional regulator [Massilia sp. YIM B02763]